MVCFICGAVSHVSKDVHQSDTWWWLYRMIYRMICREVSDLIFFFLFFFTVTNTSAFNSNESTSIDNWIWRFSAAMLRRLSAWIDAGSKFFSDLAHFHWVIGRYRCFPCRLAGRTSKISIVYRPLAIFWGVGGGSGGELKWTRSQLLPDRCNSEGRWEKRDAQDGHVTTPQCTDVSIYSRRIYPVSIVARFVLFHPSFYVADRLADRCAGIWEE